MTGTETWTDADTRAADAAWAEYQRTHDVTALDGKAVGIDPHTGEVYFGDWATDIWRQLDAEGRPRPLLITRVGRPAYGRFRLGRRL